MPSLSPLSVPGGGEGRGEAGEAPLSPAGTPHPPITAQWAPPSPRKRGEGKTAVIAGTTTFIFATGAAGKGDRSIPVEVGVNVVYSGIPFAVMMLTPDDLEDFGVGFSLTEGIVNGAADIRGLRVESDENGLRLMIDLSATGCMPIWRASARSRGAQAAAYAVSMIWRPWSRPSQRSRLPRPCRSTPSSAHSRHSTAGRS